MDNADKVAQAIHIGIVVACFLLNTNPILKAIGLFRECLALFSKITLAKEREFVRKGSVFVYKQLFDACILIGDHTNAIEYGRKLLVLGQGHGIISFKLAQQYHIQGKYNEAKELYMDVLGIVINTGERNLEAECYENLGTLCYCVGDYAKANIYLHTVLRIRKELCDKKGEALCHGYLAPVFQSVGEHDKAKESLQKALHISIEIDDKKGEALCYKNLGNICHSLGEYHIAEQYLQKALKIIRQMGDKKREALCYGYLAPVLASIGEYVKAEEFLRKAIQIEKEIGDKYGEAFCYANLGSLFQSLGEYDKAEKCLQRTLQIRKETGDQDGEASSYEILGAMFKSIGKYDKAKEYFYNALQIRVKIGDKVGEANNYGNLGVVSNFLREYVKAEKCLRKAFEVIEEIGDKNGEASCCQNLGSVLQSLGKYDKAEVYLQRALQITNQNGDKNREASCYAKLGEVFQSLAEYVKAEEFFQIALHIKKEVGDRDGEARCYQNLGTMFTLESEYGKAEECLTTALQITKEIGDKNGEASCCGILGGVFEALGKYVKAKEYHQRALQIRNEIGDKPGEATDYGNLGSILISLGEYVEAEDHIRQALAIMQDIGDRNGEGACYANLGNLLMAVGEYVKAEEYLRKALQIRKEIGDKNGEAADHGNLGAVFQYRREYGKAEECLQKSLQIRQQIGDKRGQAANYGNLGCLFQFQGDYRKAKEYHNKAVTIRRRIGDKKGEASSYENIGTVCRCDGKYSEAKEYHEKALELSYEIGCIELQFSNHLNLTVDSLESEEPKPEDALKGVWHLLQCIEKNEEMRNFLKDHDEFKISLLEKHVSPYQLLGALFCFQGSHSEALYVVELGRARALADKMSTQYFLKQPISVKMKSCFSIEGVMNKETNCACLYISYYNKNLFLWILKPNKAMLFRQINVSDCFRDKQERSVNDVFDDVQLRTFPVLPQEECEDRSFFPSTDAGHQVSVRQEKSQAASCSTDQNEGENQCKLPATPTQCVDQLINVPGADLPETPDRTNLPDRPGCRLLEDDEDDNYEPPNLAECYKMIIAPVAKLLDEPEIIIVPDRVMYRIPFAALKEKQNCLSGAAFKDKSEKYLSDSFRIRIAPSLTTLKLIRDSPADYHSQTGALIVGEPDVGNVYHKGRVEKLCPLPCAREEAKMIGRLLGVKPLLGEHATKQAVLQNIHSVSLIHFAAHGDAERGEIALAPERTTNGIPQEKDYLLTMGEISQVQLRAKLVVLSCCHSGRGQIRSEGVIGIARAFLGSGARSVLVALWALGDKATEQFMSRFYEHLVGGESASESLHRAMKWMRANGFSNVEQWAPFMLIGDNVTFNFGQ